MDWTLADTFIRTWFGDTPDFVQLMGRGDGKSLISMSAANLSKRLNSGKNDGLAGLTTTLHGTVLVYPWLKPYGDNGKRRMENETHLTHNWHRPGYWADLPAGATVEAAEELSDQLDTIGLAPSMLTGIHNPRNDTVRGGRLWWRLDEPIAAIPSGPPSLNGQRLWQWFVQALAMEHSIFDHMSIRDYSFLPMMQSPLPGSVYQGDDTMLVSYRDLGEYVDHRFVEFHRDTNSYSDAFDRRAAEVDAWLEEVKTVSYEALVRFETLFKTWDDILAPHGWRVSGTGTDTDGGLVTWWSAPGMTGPTALTKDDGLMLYDSSWLTGLKDASDCGVSLNRQMVASLLWWDGDNDAMDEDLMSGKSLLH